MQTKGAGATLMRAQLWVGAVLLLFSGCGDDDGGNEDTLFTGLSGLIILVLIVWLITRRMRNRR